jgi:dipeptidyl aminopeptidase/acylaminoacyl peptidase
LSIDSLRSRSYGSGPIKITRAVSSDEAFKRVLFEYPSDGLRITGMMNIPRGVGPFPVVVLAHGYFKPSEYKTGDGTIRAADNFARNGYLTLAPDYRCYAGSQCGPNPLYVGYAIDVLNLIASLPSLPYADTSRIGIWGHSMGGGITIRVLTITDQIKVASLYGALSADDEVHYCWLYGCRTPVAPTREPANLRRYQQFDPDFLQGLETPALSSPDPNTRLHEIFLKSSPSRYLAYINAPIMIHHGESDDVVPIQWSIDLSNSLNALGKPASLYTYPGEGHVFAGWGWQLFMARTLSFFNEYLNPRETPITADRRVLRQERNTLDSTY